MREDKHTHTHHSSRFGNGPMRPLAAGNNRREPHKKDPIIRDTKEYIPVHIQ